MKTNNIEMRLYELLGIRYFKKLVLKISLFNGKKPGQIKGSNYYLAKGDIVEACKKFQKELKYNASIHILGLVFSLIYFIMSPEIFYAVFAILQFYCVVLQRYNWIRIKEILERAENRKVIADNQSEVKLELEKKITNTITIQSKEIIEEPIVCQTNTAKQYCLKPTNKRKL